MSIGNPDSSYRGTYHNAGHALLDALAKKRNYTWRHRKEFDYVAGEDQKLAKSNLFMNESGQAVRKTLAFLKIRPAGVLVVHDDTDLILGTYKISRGASSAGHKGSASVIDALGTKDFARLRLGVRPERWAKSPRIKAGLFVLRAMSPDDREKLYSVFEELIKNVIENEARPLSSGVSDPMGS